MRGRGVGVGRGGMSESEGRERRVEEERRTWGEITSR